MRNMLSPIRREFNFYFFIMIIRSVRRRMGSLMRKVISVCDRESDIYEYLNFKVKSEQRVVIGAVQNRRLKGSEFNNLQEAIKNANKLGEYQVNIAQKMNRKARIAFNM